MTIASLFLSLFRAAHRIAFGKFGWIAALWAFAALADALPAAPMR
jgi:hypothetical protein